ncbi:hypothetical protein IWX90DRAFT_485342 [Phyllosticta citrichinensis]|uniref:Uncharacterized protein n=1 Tax=Phyllosticta citrichinensis TaxID=1130410 RepID=A0ABR1XVH8_9PEZI
MEAPRSPSSVYSRDEDGIPIEASNNAPVTTPARPSLAESSFNSLLLDRMSLQSPRAEGKMSAIASLANRLLFTDGFQQEIIRALRLVHVELRVTLAQGVRPENINKIQRHSAAVSDILALWTRSNQNISGEVVSVSIKNLPTTLQEAVPFKEKMLRLPTINGCELNFAAAHRLHIYFVDCVASPFQSTRGLMHDLPRIAAAAQSIQSCFHMVQDRFEDVAFSAEQLSRDTVKAWQHVAQIRAEIEAEEDKRRQEEKEDKSSRSKRPFKSLFSKFRGHAKKDSDDTTKASEDDHNSDLPNPRLSLGLLEAGKRPRLAVFPPAPLHVLEQQQKDVLRHHENVRRQSQLSQRETIRVVSNQSQARLPESHESKHDSHAVLQSPRQTEARQPAYEPTVNRDSTNEENGRRDQECYKDDHESVPNRKRIVDQRLESEADQDGELEELSQLEQEILEASVPDHLSQPDSNEDPEAARSWWRKRALQALETGGDVGEQGGDSAGEEEDQEEELTEEELAKRREEAKAKALAMLEGEGDDQGGNDAGPVAYDFSKLSFGPDEMERLGRQL